MKKAKELTIEGYTREYVELQEKSKKNKKIASFIEKSLAQSNIERLGYQRAISLDVAAQAIRFGNKENGNDLYISLCKLFKCDYKGRNKIIRYCNASGIELSATKSGKEVFFELTCTIDGRLELNFDKKSVSGCVEVVEYLLSLKEVLIEGYYTKEGDYKEFSDSTVDEIEKIVNGFEIER